MTDLPTPADGNPVRPFPFLSILAIIAMPLLGYGSLPFWKWEITRQIDSAPTSPYAPDPYQFAFLGVIAGVATTAAAAAVLGLALSWLAGRRNERWKGLRIFAWIVNGLAVALGAILLIRALF